MDSLRYNLGLITCSFMYRVGFGSCDPCKKWGHRGEEAVATAYVCCCFYCLFVCFFVFLWCSALYYCALTETNIMRCCEKQFSCCLNRNSSTTHDAVGHNCSVSLQQTAVYLLHEQVESGVRHL